jgi:hypothetical protein
MCGAGVRQFTVWGKTDDGLNADPGPWRTIKIGSMTQLSGYSIGCETMT